MNETAKYILVGLGLLWVLSMLPDATWMYDSSKPMCTHSELYLNSQGTLSC
jgi:hypothetical protein